MGDPEAGIGRDHRWIWAGAFAVCAVLVVVRNLVDLSGSPPGLYVDEASIGYNAWAVAHFAPSEGPDRYAWGPDRLAWIVVLLVQSVPHASSLVVSLVSAFPLPARLLGTSYRPLTASGKRAETDPAS